MPTRRQPGTCDDPHVLLNKPTLRIDEAAFLLEVTSRTVERYLHDGKLDWIRTLGGPRRVRTDSLKRYLA